MSSGGKARGVQVGVRVEVLHIVGRAVGVRHVLAIEASSKRRGRIVRVMPVRMQNEYTMRSGSIHEVYGEDRLIPPRSCERSFTGHTSKLERIERILTIFELHAHLS